MNTTFIPQLIAKTPSYVSSNKPSYLTQFFKWAEEQNGARFIWLGAALLLHASFLTPFTVMAVMFTSNSFPLVMIALGAMGLSLVTNLAALPTRITIPAFFLSILIDIIVVIASVALF